jgi:hypothetical protein
MTQFFSYYRRLFAEAWRKNIGFAKRKMAFGSCMAVVSAIEAWKYGIPHQAASVLLRGLCIVAVSYLTVFCVGFVLNLFYAPVSLDSKRAADVADLSGKVRAQENRAQLHARFVGLMQEAENLADDLRRGVAQAHYGRWLEERRQWRDRVNQALIDSGFQVEAAAFRHASEPGNFNPPPGQVADGPYYRQFYGAELERSRAALGDIVRERMA